ncbi:CKLF-like MARVEL transmembrane domain-containing protein 7 isoform X5 [Melopsittacus undulatus]|uniref:CKLF-like MARVEL transmembrane domain-containing protein 7 isoform X5 n=1 Tax=Melopsittacus undulatus TaxID=13146 RepID=UPI0012435F54|nr:CKLF-like MARVEL transmembrane domain-containing protein 7 isoform X5 [Melopsittacus undulatus]
MSHGARVIRTGVSSAGPAAPPGSTAASSSAGSDAELMDGAYFRSCAGILKVAQMQHALVFRQTHVSPERRQFFEAPSGIVLIMVAGGNERCERTRKKHFIIYCNIKGCWQCLQAKKNHAEVWRMPQTLYWTRSCFRYSPCLTLEPIEVGPS